MLRTILLIACLATATVKAQSVLAPIWTRLNVDGCLAVQGGEYSNGTPIVLADCHITTQAWTFEAAGQSTEISLSVNGPNDFCIDAINDQQSNKLELWECNGSPQQQWMLNSNGNGQTIIQLSSNNGLCLDVTDGSMNFGNQMETYQCTGNLNQAWTTLKQLN